MRTFSRFTIIGKTVDRPAKMFSASGKELNCTTVMVDVHHGGDKSSRFTCEAWNEVQATLANIHANQQVLICGQIKINTFQTTRGSNFSRTVLYLDDCQALAAPQPISPDLLTKTTTTPEPRNYPTPAPMADEDYPF